MRPTRLPVSVLLLVLTSLVLQISGAEDLYWEGEEDASNEFLEVKDEDLGVGGRIRRQVSGFFDLFSPFSTSTTTAAPEAEVATNDPDMEEVPDEREDDLDHGSGLPARAEPELEKEKTLRVTFVVMEPYQSEFSNRDSVQFQNFSRSLADAVNLLYDSLPGTQRASLVRIQSRVSDEFSCKVTLDIVTNDNTDKITKILQDHIHNRRKLGSATVSDAGFGANVIDPGLVSCDADEIRCGDDACVPGAARCNGYDDCDDGSDEQDCPYIVNLTGGSRYNQAEALSPDCERNVPCPSSSVMICASQRCDGTPDCPDQADEYGCDRETPGGTTSRVEPRDDNAFQSTTGRAYDADTTQQPPEEDAEPEGTTRRGDSAFQSTTTRAFVYPETTPQPPQECSESDFACDDTRCVPFSARCDGYADCADGADEAGCLDSWEAVQRQGAIHRIKDISEDRKVHDNTWFSSLENKCIKRVTKSDLSLSL